METASRAPRLWPLAVGGVLAVALAVMAATGGCTRRHPPRGRGAPPAATLVGHLSSAAGLPLTDAQVEAVPDTTDDRDPLAVARVAADGTFRIPSLPPGHYRLRGRAPGHVDATTSFVVTSAAQVSASLTLQRAYTLRGQVIDGHGAAVPGARVLAFSPAPPAGAAAPRPAEAIADAEGRFALERLARGAHRLLVEAAGFASAAPPPVEVPGDSVVVRLGGAGQAVIGKVVTAGAPAGGARVRLGGEGASPPRETTARADGTFTFTGLGPGSYALSATRGALVSPTVAAVVPGGARSPPQLELVPGIAVQGRVIDDTGAAMPGAEVRVETSADDPLPRTAVAGRGGRFEAGPLPPGQYRALPRRPGYVARRVVTIQVTAGAPPPLQTLELVRGAAVSGRVTDARGGGLAGAAVRCLAAGTEDLTVLFEPLPLAAEAAALPAGAGRALGNTRTVHTDATGRFTIDDLLPGRFHLEVMRAAAVPLRTDEFTLAPGQRRDAGTLALRDGVAVRGRVLDEAGGAIAGAHVAVRPQGGADLGLFGVTDGAGQFTLSLPPGRYTLLVSAPGVSEQSLALQVDDAAPPAPVEVRLARADGVLDGVATDDGGRPVARARVVAWPAGGGRAQAPPADATPLGSAVTDAGGHFTIAHVPRRLLLVEVRHPDYPATFQTATPGTLVIVSVPIPGGVAGEVREHATGAVVARFRVEAAGPDGRTATATGARSGSFSLPRLAPGHWRLTAAAPGFHSAEREVDVPPSTQLGEPSLRDVRLELDPAR